MNPALGFLRPQKPRLRGVVPSPEVHLRGVRRTTPQFGDKFAFFARTCRLKSGLGAAPSFCSSPTPKRAGEEKWKRDCMAPPAFAFRRSRRQAGRTFGSGGRYLFVLLGLLLNLPILPLGRSLPENARPVHPFGRFGVYIGGGNIAMNSIPEKKTDHATTGLFIALAGLAQIAAFLIFSIFMLFFSPLLMCGSTLFSIPLSIGAIVFGRRGRKEAPKKAWPPFLSDCLSYPFLCFSPTILAT